MQDGRIVEQGPAAALLRDPPQEYTRVLLAAVPTEHTRGSALSPAGADAAGRRRPAAGRARRAAHPTSCSRRSGLVKRFRGARRSSAPSSTTSRSSSARRDPRHRRRVRLGQDHHGPHRPGPRGPDGGGGAAPASRGRPPRARRPLRAQIGVVYQDPLSSLRPALVRRAHPRRRARRPASARPARRAEARTRRPGCWSRSGSPRRTWPAPAAAVGRAAPARRHRPRAGRRTVGHRLRRAGVGARRLDPGPGPRPARPTCRTNSGVSYLFISHDLGVIHHISDRVLVMKDGRVVESGTADDVFDAPAAPTPSSCSPPCRGSNAAPSRPPADQHRRAATDPMKRKLFLHVQAPAPQRVHDELRLAHHHGQWRRPDTRQAEFNDLDVGRPREDPRARQVRRDLLRRRRRALRRLPRRRPQVRRGGPAGAEQRPVGAGRARSPTPPSTSASRSPLDPAGAPVQLRPPDLARSTTLSKGRVAWNIVTNYLPNASRNFGLDGLTKHDERYALGRGVRRGHLQAVGGLLGGRRGARDRERGVYADPARSTRSTTRASTTSRGPHLPAPSPQRTPVLFQAGASDAGREFAARHAEACSSSPRTRRSPRRIIADIRAPARSGPAAARGHQVLPGPVLRGRRHRGGGQAQGAEIDQYVGSTASSRTSASSARPSGPPPRRPRLAGSHDTAGRPLQRPGARHSPTASRRSATWPAAPPGDPRRRHARADRRRARGVAGRRGRRHQRHQRGDPRARSSSSSTR